MATEGTFSGNDSSSIDQVMLTGFTGMLTAITDQSKVLTSLDETLTKYATDEVIRDKANTVANKALLKQITKSFDLIKNETNPLLVSMVDAIKNMNNASASIVSSTNASGNIQVITWESSQFNEFIKTMEDSGNTDGQVNVINSMSGLFSGIITGMGDVAQANKGDGSLLSTLQNMFQPNAVSQAKVAVKVYTVVINGIVAALVKVEKHAPKIERSAESLTKVISSIQSVTKGMTAPKEIKALAGSIAVLGLSLVAFALVSPAVLVAVGALTLLKGVTVTMAKGLAKDIFIISAAIALFGLSIWGLSEIVTVDSLLKTAAAILLLGFAIKGFSMAIGGGLGKQGMLTLILATVTVAALGIAIQQYNDVKWEDMGKAAAAMIALAGAMFVIAKVPDAAIGAASMLLGAAALGAIGLALRAFPSNTDNYLGIGLFVLGYGTTLAAAGLVAPLIALGAGAMLIGGVALITMAAGMAIINSTKFEKSKIVDFTESLKYFLLGIGTKELAIAGTIAAIAVTPMFIATTMATLMALQLSLISNLSYDPDGAKRLGEVAYSFFSVMGSGTMLKNAIIAAVVAVPMLLAATMGSVIALELALISNLSYDQEGVNNFGLGMTGLAKTYMDVGSTVGIIGSIKFLAGVALATTMAIATPIVAIALVATSVAAKAINPKDIDTFSGAVKGLIKVYTDNSVSVLQMPKLMANVKLIGDIANTTIDVSKGIKSFTEISEKPSVINDAVSGVGDFVSQLIGILSDKGKELSQLPEDALKVLGIGNLMKDVATGMIAMGNMEYYETKLVDGKIVKVGEAKKFTSADYKRVGDSLSLMISAVSVPLAAIGDQGGWFSSNKTKKGIEALAQIGSVFNPIVDVVNSFRGGDKQITSVDVADISKSISTLLLGISGTFIKLDKEGTLDYFSSNSVVMTGLRDTLKYLGSLQGDNLSKVSTEIKDIFNTIGNEKPFKNLTDNLKNIRKEATAIKDQINKFDLQKLTMFNQTTKNLLDAAKNGTMEQLVRALGDLINEMRTSKAPAVTAAPTNSTPFNFTQPAPGVALTPVIPVATANTPTKTPAELAEERMSGMVEMLRTEIKALGNKWQNPMPVKVVSGQLGF